MAIKINGEISIEERILVIGSAGTGKTSLINMLGEAVFDTTSPATQGIGISHLELRSEEMQINVSVWDFGGQVIYQPLYAAFASHKSIHLLVLDDGINLDQDAENWLEEISACAIDAPCIIVLNKTERTLYELNRRDLLSRYPFIIGFAPVDLPTGRGVDELRAILIEIIAKRKQSIGFSFNFIRIKGLLEEEISHHITLSEFKYLCKKHDIPDEVDIASVVHFFHDYGLLYYYHLPNTEGEEIIIQVNWLIKGISSILEVVQIMGSQGDFFEEDVISFLKNREYSRQDVQLLLALINSTGIGFKFENGRIILPSFLPRTMPDNAYDFIRGSNGTHLYFDYDYLSRRFFNRILTALQRLGMEQIWFDGILVSGASGTALVKMDDLRKRIDLFVNMQESGGKRLLQKIRKIIWDANETFRYSDCEEWVVLPGSAETAIQYEELLLLNERKTTFITKFINKKPVDINISELLKSMLVEEENKALKVFISSAHKDLELKNELVAHLSPLVHNNSLDIFDTEPMPGVEWEMELIKQLDDADLVLVLVSPDLLASKYIYQVELYKILQLHDTGRATIVPILIRDTLWESLPINKIQMLPFDGRSIINNHDRDAAWRSVVAEIGKMIGRMTGRMVEVNTLKIIRITLHNIRCFDEMDLDMRSSEAPQMISLFLGENGVGKSTILKSIPLGVANESETIAMLTKMSGDLLKVGTEEGKISIGLLSDKENKEFVIETNLKKVNGELVVNKVFPPELDLKQLFICGYGASRNRFGTDNLESYSVANSCASLFSYDAALQNPELSFRRIQGRGISIDSLLRRVDQLLMLEPGSSTMDNTGLRLRGPWGEFVPIGGLGDGYKAMLGWISDLLAWSLLFDERMFQTSISGVVIIDELEQHLHPRWQLIVIKLLKDIFPRLQFIISSHTPLLATGAADYGDTGIYTIERQPENNIKVKQLSRDVIEGKNVNNVLLEAFGMLSSLSPKSIQNIERFAYLSSQPALNIDDTNELQNLGYNLAQKDDTPSSEIDDVTLKNRLSNFF